LNQLIAGAKLSLDGAPLQLQNGKVFKVGAQNVICRSESFLQVRRLKPGMSKALAILWR
jgi:hypothetical protein